MNNDSKVCDYNQETNPQGTKQNAYANAILLNDIVLNEELLSNRNEDGTFADGYEPRSWTPLQGYYGTFDGGSHIIKGVYIDTDSPFMGLFGSVSAAKIKNLGVEDSYVKGTDNVGGLVGSSNSSYCVIDHCHYSGIVSGWGSVGGITGFGKGNVTNCYSEGTISGSSNYPWCIGGITGYCCYDLSIENCYYIHETGIGEKDEYSVEENVCQVTDAQMTDGYVAYALQSNQAEQNGVVPKVWGQILSGTHKQNAPVLSGETVYRTEDTEGAAYSNYVQQLGIGSQDGILSDIWYAFVPADTGYYSFAGDSGVNICLVSDLGKDIEWKDAGDSPVYLLSEAQMYYVMVKKYTFGRK